MNIKNVHFSLCACFQIDESVPTGMSSLGFPGIIRIPDLFSWVSECYNNSTLIIYLLSSS
jgi:hypothetical protein